MSEAPQAALFASDGTPKGEVKLDPAVFGVEPNIPVMHQVITAQLAAARSGTASTKTRSEVRGGGRKPWRQKGLGRARQGSIRSPQWVGGGVVFGPHPRDYGQRTPKKMKKLALRGALSARAAENSIKVVETLDWTEPKTKTAQALLEAIGASRKALIVLGPTNRVAERSFRNLPQVAITRSGQLSAYDVLWADTVLFTTDTLGSVAAGSYDVSDKDFVMESAADAPDSVASSQSPVSGSDDDFEEEGEKS
ncbi:MAG: 50S ribosomal protein L4 [Acidimicrobiia bacterium]|nr:50S ribosomal protein L4 [Acidimicrobiia bacterium]MDH5615122.1 50S ribosomal protein L4 [Acidimicrobiia bacterium]